ncbi:hypothetical protein ACFPT7_10905 [Acidicapsa dinghuensis]|uniref:Uncharacterized protein n=1 Tax=Acidicapsa dinghuensis TaxID=2218256 RepID=A0ABW1EG17_9BACT|nr:hypothetical protein [Acidicapsa dinghuensis]
MQRNGVTLPIAEVPNLLPGDRLWIHPDLPDSQSAHFVLVVAFLRGATNPPPPDWFRRVETWNREVKQEGVFVTVPQEAQQALIFLAPETSGDFDTLRKTVHDRPGTFVRAGQDLQQASWDRLRLDEYLAEVKTIPPTDTKALKEGSELAARSLGIKVDSQCYDKPSEQQAPCLTQHPDGMVLDDSGAQSMVNQMANGSAADMMSQLSYSTTFGGGVYSPYVGAIVDMAKILSSIHTAKYQYIPALALPQKSQEDTLNLRLNVAPSFRNPKSVIVVALPPIGPTKLPAMHASEADASSAVTPANFVPTYCSTKPKLVFNAEGAPLVYSTAMAHNLYLHIDTKAQTPQSAGDGQEHAVLKPTVGAGVGVASSSGVDIPVEPFAIEGGFVLDKPLVALPEAETTAELRGSWGFDTFAGPKFNLVSPHPGKWTIASGDHTALITGREDTLHLQGESTLCVQEVQADIPPAASKTIANPVKLAWKSPKPEQLEMTVPMKDAAPGDVSVLVKQYGMAVPDKLSLRGYAEAAAIDHLTLSAGDQLALLKGKRLDEVETADLAGISFAPSALNRVQDEDQLDMSATGSTATLKPGDDYIASVTLRDGRTLHVPATVERPRPQVELLSKGVQQPTQDEAAPQPVQLGSPDDLPLQRRVVFFVRSKVPANFPRAEKIEVAAEDGSFSTTLSLADGSLLLEDAHTAVASLDPLDRFGASAFGPIQFRAVSAGGVSGDWVPLGTLVRLPGFTGNPTAKELRCPRSLAKPCLLTGTNLFLITSVGTVPDMSNAVDVPPQFTGTALTVPNVSRTGMTGTLYFKLRDDPDTVQTLNLPVASPTGSLAGSNGVEGAALATSANSTKTEPATPKSGDTVPGLGDASAGTGGDAKPTGDPKAATKPNGKQDAGTASQPNL